MIAIEQHMKNSGLYVFLKPIKAVSGESVKKDHFAVTLSARLLVGLGFS
jgi:hypothetical protein